MTTDLSQYDPNQLPCAEKVAGQRYAIIVADWNQDITYALAQGAMDTLLKHGAKRENIYLTHVPGTVELTYGAKHVIEVEKPDAVIIIGCVIQGETPHFDYVCQSVTEGMTLLNATSGVPVVFSVLTTLNKQQALDRAGGKLGNKGVEGAVTAIRMANIRHENL